MKIKYNISNKTARILEKHKIICSVVRSLNSLQLLKTL